METEESPGLKKGECPSTEKIVVQIHGGAEVWLKKVRK